MSALIDMYDRQVKELTEKAGKYEAALIEINSLRSTTMNYGVARAIACRALGVKHTDSSVKRGVIKECWTKKGGRFEIQRATSKEVFEFSDTSERVDQLRNACYLAQRLLDDGEFSAFVLIAEGERDHKGVLKVVEDGQISKEFLGVSYKALTPTLNA